jgi:hypothetical protein
VSRTPPLATSRRGQVTLQRGTFVKCRFREWKHSRFTYSAYTSRQNRRSVIREGMGIKLRFARFVGAATVMVVLLLAPSVASAHAGHHPAPGPVAQQITEPAEDIPAQAAPKASPRYLMSVAASHSPSSDNFRCHQGNCCAGAPCTACCAVAVPDFAPSIPPALSSALTPPDSSTSDSLDPDGLRRPPRFFA